MKNIKLKLSELSVQSFVTSNKLGNLKTIKGGETEVSCTTGETEVDCPSANTDCISTPLSSITKSKTVTDIGFGI